MKLALAQLSLRSGAVTENVSRAREAIRDAAARGADLVALPEIFNVGYFAFDAYRDHAEPIGGPTLSSIAELAATEEIAVLAGSIVEDLAATTTVDTPADHGLANTAVLFDATGTRQLVYRKHHLFGYESAEQDLLEPGETLQVATIGGMTVGVTTCYDLRFPQLYRRLIDAGVTLVLVPSAWPYPRVEHWQTLPRARAIENLCYVGAVNAAGDHPEASCLGRSTIYDPWGTPRASAGEEAMIITATVDPDRVRAVREDFPALDDRRDD